MSQRIRRRNQRGNRTLRNCAIVTGSLSLLSSAAFAQDTLQEVVVTAQKREQNIQNVPIAITAFTADTLKSKGIGDIHALSNLTPNVNLDSGAPFSGDSSVLSASIRGIGQDDFAFNLDPGVGVYLDGVFLARTIGANQNLLDVDRIEILKGPQGTLFGRNTIGGAINIVTHTPGRERKLEVQATTGSFNRRDFAATADLPISENLLTSITASWNYRNGYQDVIPYPSGSPYQGFAVDPVRAYPKGGYDSADNLGGMDNQIIRGKALWNASDKLTVTFSADYQHQNQPSTAVTTLRVFPQTSPFAGIYNFCISNPASVLNSLIPANAADAAYISASIPAFTPGAPGGMNLGQTTPIFNTTDGLCGPRSAVAGLSNGSPALGGAGYVGGPGGGLTIPGGTPRIYWDENSISMDRDKTYSTGVSFAKNRVFGGSITADLDLTDNLSLKSISGYRQISWHVGIDLDGTPEQLQEVTDAQHQQQFSQEFQLNGKALNDRLNYVGGVYYFEESGYVHDYVPFEGILNVYDFANDVDTKSVAAYVHTDYKLTDRFSATVGARYSRDKKKFEGGQGDLNGFSYKLFGCPPDARPAVFPVFGGVPNTGNITCREFVGFPDANNPLRYFPPGELEQNFNVFTPKLGFQFQATDDVMLYTSWSKGFKSGGWTTRLSQPILSGTQAEFKPEFAKTTELGVKSELFDRRMLVNAALFYTDYTDIQLQVQQGPSPVTQNAGDAKLKGFELETQTVLGNGVSLNFSGGYIDAYYTFINPDTLIPSGSDLPKTPKYKFSFGPTYEFGVQSGGRVRLQADYTYSAELFNDSLNTPELRRPVSHDLDAAVHYLPSSDAYELIVGGTNLTNDRYLTTGSINLGAGQMSGTFNAPRQWYVSVRANFGGQ
jgi:outer membrane receptor protein involved in Fe transport